MSTADRRCRVCECETIVATTVATAGGGTVEVRHCRFCDRRQCPQCKRPEPTGRNGAHCPSCGAMVALH